MTDECYKHFLVCRQTKLFTKGIQAVLDKFNVTRQHELKQRKIVEMFGYVLRTVLQKLVLDALKIQTKNLLRVLDHQSNIELQAYE